MKSPAKLLFDLQFTIKRQLYQIYYIYSTFYIYYSTSIDIFKVEEINK